MASTEIHCGATQPNWVSLLPAGERERVLRKLAPEDKQLALATRVLIRAVISAYLGGNPGDWRFDLSPTGKPYLSGAPQPLAFNLSHSGNLVACAIAGQQGIGVDIEDSRVERNFLALARRFFTPQEYTELASLPAAAQANHFYQLWTLKESHLKARGLGLANGLDRYCFQRDNHDKYHLSAPPDTPGQWQHRLLSAPPGYQIAISRYSTHEQPPEMRVETCRMDSERLFALWRLGKDG
ncbi:4'-phosphopantetheinyl transferase family protein [Porticoccus sp.]